MKAHSRLRVRPWMLPIIVAVLVAAHVIVPYVLSHTVLPVAVVSGVAIVVVIKHLGLLGSLYALRRRRFRQPEHREAAPRTAARSRGEDMEEEGE